MSRNHSFSLFFVFLVSFLFELLFLPSNAFSQNKPDFREFDFRALDYQFNRADREIYPNRWMEEARRGIIIAQSLWEELAAGLFDDPALRQEASREFAQWTEDELTERFTQWLLARFFGAGTGILNSELLRETEKANRKLIYHTDIEGAILYDDATGDPLLIRPSEEGHEFQRDLNEWRVITRESLEDKVQSYEARLAGFYPELLAFLDADKREQFDKKIGDFKIAVSQSFSNELKGILSREERYFTARRLGDNYSLRKKNENESAELTIVRLIEETNNSVLEGLAALRKKIEAAEAGTGDLVLEGSEWLYQYREQFERGLDTWEKAEEQFFIRRIQWEQEANSNYLEGEEAWNRAFEQFETSRKNWELHAKELFDSGEALFINASETLEKSILDAKVEFERDALLRSSIGADRAKAWTDIYINSGLMVAKAKENIDFWQEKYDKEKDEKRSEGIMAEIDNWTNIYEVYYEKALEARGMLIDEFSVIMGSGNLADILNGSVSSEDFFLDEYQIELIRAKAVAGYWERRTEIAEAVVRYAEDLTSGRITEGEGLKVWELAKNEYNTALSQYEQSMELLKISGEEINNTRKNLDEAVIRLKESELKLDELNKTYNDYMAIYIAGGKEYFLEKKNEKQGSLNRLYDILDNFDEGSLWNSYLTSLCKLEFAKAAELKTDILKELETGGGIYQISLMELEKSITEIKIIKEMEYLSPKNEDYNLKETNPYYSIIFKILDEWQINLNKAGTFEAKKEVNDQYAEIFSELIESAYLSLENQYKSRIWGINLLQDDPDTNNTVKMEILDKLQIDYESIYLEILKAKIKLEYDALGYYIGVFDNGISEKAVWLSHFCSVPEGTAVSYRETLSQIMEILNKNKEKSIYDILYLLEDDNNKKIIEYLKSGSYFIIDYGYSYTDTLIGELLRERQRIEDSLKIYQLTVSFSPSFLNTETLKQYSKLKEFYDFHNISIDDAIIPDNMKLYEFFVNSENKEELLLSYAGLLDNFFSVLPEWMSAQNDSWLGPFIQLLMDPSPVLQDRIRAVQRSSNIVNSSYKIYIQQLPGNEVLTDLNVMINAVETTNDEILIYFDYENLLNEEIKELERKIGIIYTDESNIKERIDDISMEINAAKDDQDTLFKLYKEAAEKVIESGNRYDKKYGEVKEHYSILELRQKSFEKQDAIRRWADTAYLDFYSALDEFEISRDKYERSKIALEALRDIYNNGESSRLYENDEYTSLYIEYRDSFSKLFLSLKARGILNTEIEKEQIKNNEIYEEYKKYINLLGGNLKYIYPDNFVKDISNWNIYDIIKIVDGKLRFSFKGSFEIDGNNKDNADDLLEYLMTGFDDPLSLNNMTMFEKSLVELNKRLEGYFSNSGKYEQWGLAHDYLIRNIMEYNSYNPLFNTWSEKAEVLKSDSQLGRLYTYFTTSSSPGIDKSPLYIYSKQYLSLTESRDQAYAYQGLGEKEKEDLEFFIILNLLGGGYKKSDSFERVSEYYLYSYTYNDVYQRYRSLRNHNKGMLFFSYVFGYRSEERETGNTLGKLGSVVAELKKNIDESKSYLNGNVVDFTKILNKYQESSDRLRALNLNTSGGNEIKWENIESALYLTEKLSETEIAHLQNFWLEIGNDNNLSSKSILDSLNNLVNYYQNVIDNNKNKLEEVYSNNLIDLYPVEVEYKNEFEGYINGRIDLLKVVKLAENVYGKDNLGIKNHLENLIIPIIDQMGIYIDEFGILENEYTKLSVEYVDLMKRAYGERFNAELGAREAQWEQQRLDILDKYNSWITTSESILETGRNSWKDNNQKLYETYSLWSKNFEREYRDINAAWNAVYLEGLNDKELWINRASETADKASSEAILLLMGADAESGARALYSRDPIYYYDTGYGNLAAIMEQALNNTGIISLNEILNSAERMAEHLSYYQQSGLSGGKLWNQGIIAAEAYYLANNAKEEVLSREAARMAFNIQDMAVIAVREFEESVKNSNKNFKAQMDNIFIMEGYWARSGKGYKKEVIVHSTLLNPIITKNVYIDGFTDFIMDPVYLYTDISETRIKGLDTFAIQIIIDNIYSEINALYNEYFYDRRGMDNPRFTSFGKFGFYIGYMPEQKKSDVDPDRGISGVFEDYGHGELGRLMTEYIFWNCKEEKGINSMAIAPWDKPIWDSRGSIFHAPSLRVAANIGLQVVTSVGTLAAALPTGGMSIVGGIALNAALNTADEVFFTALDMANGMKFDIGLGNIAKSYAMNFASSAIGTVFGGTKTGTGGFFDNGITGTLVNKAVTNGGQAVMKIASTGLQNITTGTVNGLLGAVSYNGNGKWNFDGDYALQSLKNSGKGAIVSMSSMATSEVLNIGMNGFVKELSENGRKLNATLGGLTGQGINYAMGNDFTINLFNFNTFSNNMDAGLLEMHIGREGTNMQLGMGGVDLSYKSFISSIKGLEAWKVNGQLLFSDNMQVREYASQMRTLYSDTDQTRQEFANYIEGKTRIVKSYLNETQSVYDEITGIKTVFLGTDAQNDDSRYGLNVILAHEAYRDGIIGSSTEQLVETNRAVMGHMETAAAILETYEGGLGLGMTLEGLSYNLYRETGDVSLINTIMTQYDSSADYWKLLKNGNLMYDGFATLTDEWGDVILSAKDMQIKEGMIETALIKILKLDPANKEDVAAVRQMMVDAGLEHSFSYNPEEWYWAGDRDVEMGILNNTLYVGKFNLTDLNYGETISIGMISYLYNSLGTDNKVIEKFINKTYGSSLDLMLHAGFGYSLDVVRNMLSGLNDLDQMKMLNENFEWYREALLNGADIESMISGTATRSQKFDVTSDIMDLVTSSVPDAKKFQEEHTGIDYGSRGTSVSIPGGYWQFIKKDDHRAYFQLFGGDLKMRIMHLDPDDIASISENAIFGGEKSVIAPYPTKSFGSGTGAHVHIDMTRLLPYQNKLIRQFINPETLMPGKQLEYRFWYKDKDGNDLPKYPMNFDRY